MQKLLIKQKCNCGTDLNKTRKFMRKWDLELSVENRVIYKKKQMIWKKPVSPDWSARIGEKFEKSTYHEANSNMTTTY